MVGWGLAVPAGVGPVVWSWLSWNLGSVLYATVWTVFVQRLGAEPVQLGLVIGGAAVGRTLLSYPAGVLVDRFPPLRLHALAMALPVAGMTVLILSTAWWQALIAALLVELSGLGVPALSTWLAGASGSADRTATFTAVYTLAPQVALLAGPVLAGLIGDWLGLRVVFAGAAALFALAVLLVLPLALSSGRSPSLDGHPVRSAASGPPDEDGNGTGDGAATSVRSVLADRSVRDVVALHLLVALVPFAGLVLLSNDLVEERGVSLALLGVLGSVGAAVGIGAGLLVARTGRFQRPLSGIAACLVMAAVALALFLVDGPAVVLVLAFMARALLNPVWSFLGAALAEVTAGRARGRAYGLAETAAGVGDTAAPFAAGALYQAGPQWPLVAALAGTVPLALWTVALSRRFRGQPAGD